MAVAALATAWDPGVSVHLHKVTNILAAEAGLVFCVSLHYVPPWKVD